MAWQDFPIRYGHAQDLDPTNADSWSIVGAMPLSDGFASDNGYTASPTGTMVGLPNGAAEVYTVDGTRKVFIGTPTKLYEWNGSAASGVTDRSGTTYGSGTTSTWSFAQFGDNTLAVNINNKVQRSTGGAFSDVTSTAPKGSIIVNMGFPASPVLMVFDYDDGTRYRDGWKCTALSSDVDWAGGSSGRLLEPTGPFTAAVPFRDGVIAFKKNAMYYGEYVGTVGAPYQWRRITDTIGCVGKNAVVRAEDAIYWADPRGFYVYDGSYPRRLQGFTHEEWANEYSYYLSSLGDWVYATFDPDNAIVRWRYTINITKSAQRGFAFNTRSGLWTRQAIGSPKYNYDTAAPIVFAGKAYGASPDLLPCVVDAGKWAQCTVTTPKVGSSEQGVTLRGVWPKWAANTRGGTFLGPDGAATWWPAGTAYFYGYDRPQQTTANYTTRNASPPELSGKVRGQVAGKWVQGVFYVDMSSPWCFSGCALDLVKGSKE